MKKKQTPNEYTHKTHTQNKHEHKHSNIDETHTHTHTHKNKKTNIKPIKKQTIKKNKRNMFVE